MWAPIFEVCAARNNMVALTGPAATAPPAQTGPTLPQGEGGSASKEGHAAIRLSLQATTFLAFYAWSVRQPVSRHVKININIKLLPE
jgi:hypothetical protein